MTRRLKKGTIAKNIINSHATTRQIDLIPISIDEGCTNINKAIEDLHYKKKILLRLRDEFLDDKVGFIKKYAKPKRPYHFEEIKRFIKKENAWKEIGKRMDKKSGMI